MGKREQLVQIGEMNKLLLGDQAMDLRPAYPPGVTRLLRLENDGGEVKVLPEQPRVDIGCAGAVAVRPGVAGENLPFCRIKCEPELLLCLPQRSIQALLPGERAAARGLPHVGAIFSGRAL